MPEVKDIAAWPTSWALTLWDALPLFLSVEVALALALVVVLRPELRRRPWILTATYPFAGVAYLALFNWSLAGLMLAIVVVRAVSRSLNGSVEGTETVPRDPLCALRERGGAVLGHVLVACVVTAAIKIFVRPAIEPDTVLWFVVALVTGFATPVPLGTIAIPALPLADGDFGVLAAGTTLVAASLRPLVFSSMRKFRSREVEPD
jgi:hypothetical protein